MSERVPKVGMAVPLTAWSEIRSWGFAVSRRWWDDTYLCPSIDQEVAARGTISDVEQATELLAGVRRP